jgi:enoyl-CoA hydratase
VIRSNLDGTIRILTLDRPDQRNALSLDGLDRLRDAIESTTAPVTLLQGQGDAFCAGADLADVAEVAGNPGAAETLARTGQETMRAIADAETVVVAGIDGPARGGGVELALAADLRVATTQATFAEPGVKLGIFGAWGGTHRLPRVVGHGDALDLALSGRVIDAETARRIGLVSRLVEDPKAVAHALAATDHQALQTVARLLRNEPNRSTAEEREVTAFRDLAPTAAAEMTN